MLFLLSGSGTTLLSGRIYFSALEFRWVFPILFEDILIFSFGLSYNNGILNYFNSYIILVYLIVLLILYVRWIRCANCHVL